MHFATALLLAAAVVPEPAATQRSHRAAAQRSQVEPQGSQPGETPRIGEITFEGADASSLRALVPIQPGAPFDARDVRDAVRALHGTARFSRVEAYVEPMKGAYVEPMKGANVEPTDAPRGAASAPADAGGAAQAEGTEGAPYVRLIFVLVPVEKLVAVNFPGHEALSESALHQAANLQVNAEYLPEQVPKAVKDLLTAYERIGYRQARIAPTARSVQGGVELNFQIEEGPPTRIAAIDFEGQPGLEKDELLAAFRLRSGDILNLSAVEEGIRGLRERYRKANRLRAKVEAPRIEELAGAPRVRLIVPVAAGPVVRFHVRGNRAFDDAVLDSHLFGESEEQLDAQVAQEMVARLRRFYVAAGFLHVRVAEREMHTGEGAVDVVFSVDEGPQVRVTKIVFQGNSGISSRQLRERLLLILRDNIPRDPSPGADPVAVERTGVEGRLRGLPEPRTKVDPETVYDPVLYSRALKQIEDLYKSQGYLSARAGPPKLDSLDSTGKRLQVSIPIEEGEETRVARIVVEGGTGVSPQEIDSAITLRVGQPFSYLAAEEGRSALTQIYTRRGHLYARVEDEETFVDDSATPGASRMEVRYRIQPGPVVRVAYIEVVGQRRTLEGLILDLAGLKPGEVLTPEVMDRGQQALIGTGLFFSATLTPRNPEVVESEKTVQIQVRERPTREVQASLGFSLADGPRATAQYTRANLWGRNLTFSVVGRVNFPFGRFPTRLDCPPGVGNASQCDSHIIFPTETLFGGKSFEDPIERVIDIGLSAPRLWPLTDALRAGVDLIQQRVLEPSYTLTKYSAQLSTGLTQRRPFTASLAYEVGFQEFSIGQTSVEQVLAGQDQRILRTPPGQMTFGSLRPQLLFDLRDDPARPRSGLLAEFDGDFEHSFAASASDQAGGLNRIHVNLFRAEGQLAVYVPLPFLSSVVLSARGGRVFQLDGLSSTPGDRRFYLGGATSLRGFHEDAVQPQDLINRLHAIVNACATTLSGVACSVQAQLLAAGATSAGGDQFVAFTAELRVPVARTVEVAGFYDGGNLWQAPTDILSNFVLRSAVGGGLRWVTPIGRLAVDIGVNLDPDVLLGEPRFGPYFSIDPL